MPFALVFIGLLLIVTGAKNTYREFGAELTADFTGQGNFTWWIASLGTIGALGYIKELQTFSRLFMTLIIVAMILSNRGVFAQATSALQSGPKTPASAPQNDANAIPIPAQYVPPSSGNSDAQKNFATVLNVVKLFFLP